MYQENRDELEEMREIHECDMEELRTVEWS